eukprot:2878450-Pleurochrysis_carterae.AAC.1
MAISRRPRLRRHGDALAVDEREQLVVVEHRVHRFDPQGVDGAVEQQPLLLGTLVGAHLMSGRGGRWGLSV